MISFQGRHFPKGLHFRGDDKELMITKEVFSR